MHIQIKRGKEIQFVDSLNIYLRSHHNDQQCQRLIDCFDFASEDLDSILQIISEIDYSVLETVFERINYRKNTQTNDTGKQYLAFSTKNFSSFITSVQGFKIAGLYFLWNVIKSNSAQINFKSQILNAHFFYLGMMKLEELKINRINTYFNSPEFKDPVIETFSESILLFNPELHEYYTHNQHYLSELEDGDTITLVPSQSWSLQTDANEIVDLMQNDIALYVQIQDIIYRIKAESHGYEVVFAKCKEQIEKRFIEEMQFSTGIFMPYEDEHDFETTLFYSPEKSHIIDSIQSLYNENIKLFDLCPQSENSNTRKKAENTFISQIHKTVDEALVESKASSHLIQTITGLIAYDFNIIQLETKLNVNEYSKEDSDKLRKKVDSSVSSTNKLSF